MAIAKFGLVKRAPKIVSLTRPIEVDFSKERGRFDAINEDHVPEDLPVDFDSRY